MHTSSLTWSLSLGIQNCVLNFDMFMESSFLVLKIKLDCFDSVIKYMIFRLRFQIILYNTTYNNNIILKYLSFLI